MPEQEFTEEELEELGEIKDNLADALLLMKNVYGGRSRMYARARSLYQNVKTDIKLGRKFESGLPHG